jgi:hypothetical protein
MSAAFPLILSRARRAERVAYLTAGALFASGAAAAAVLLVSGGSWAGPASLRKAATFGLSFGITLVTISWVSSWLPLGRRLRTALVGAFTAACVFETVLVSIQAWRGVPSHFNLETPFDAMVARGLAAGGATLVVLIAAFGACAFRRAPAAPPSMRLAIRVGFVSLFASLAAGGVMIATGMRLVLSGDPARAYAAGGWLKPTHAVTMHGILVLPALAWMLTFVEWPERRRYAVVAAAAIGYVTLAAAVAAVNVFAW